MTNIETRAPIQANRTAPETAGDAERGWYLYGISRRVSLASVLADPTDGTPLQLLECAGLVAIVKPVLLADFSMAVLQERLQSVSELEAMVRRHNRVIEQIHAEHAILPAKFGMVYANPRDIVSALRTSYDALLRQLLRLEGCDEWAVHVFADRAVIRERISAVDVEFRRLRDEHAAARPGRAYFLERQFRDELEAATKRALVTVAQKVFDRLAECAVVGHISPNTSSDDRDGPEILRASFLVTRDNTERFENELRSAADEREGLSYECTGPWPPYSFVTPETEKAE